jgi:hypothetical protein
MEWKSMKVMSMTEMHGFQDAKAWNWVRMSHSKASYTERNSGTEEFQPAMEWKSMTVMSMTQMHTVQCAKV